MRNAPHATDRTEIFTDGSFNDRTGAGGWATVFARTSSERQEGTSSYEMELRAIVEAVRVTEGPRTVVSAHEGIIGGAGRGTTPRMCRPLREELYAPTAGNLGADYKKQGAEVTDKDGYLVRYMGPWEGYTYFAYPTPKGHEVVGDLEVIIPTTLGKEKAEHTFKFKKK